MKLNLAGGLTGTQSVRSVGETVFSVMVSSRTALFGLSYLFFGGNNGIGGINLWEVGRGF